MQDIMYTAHDNCTWSNIMIINANNFIPKNTYPGD